MCILWALLLVGIFEINIFTWVFKALKASCGPHNQHVVISHSSNLLFRFICFRFKFSVSFSNAVVVVVVVAVIVITIIIIATAAAVAAAAAATAVVVFTVAPTTTRLCVVYTDRLANYNFSTHCWWYTLSMQYIWMCDPAFLCSDFHIVPYVCFWFGLSTHLNVFCIKFSVIARCCWAFATPQRFKYNTTKTIRFFLYWASNSKIANFPFN